MRDSLEKERKNSKMEYSLILSGQGSEKTAMLRDVVDNNEFAKEFIQKSEEILKIRLMDIINSNDIKKITDPKVNQFMLFLFHNIYSKLIMESFNEMPNFIAGHSVGQLCSYSVSGVALVEDMLGFLKERTDIINDVSIQNRAKFVNGFGITYDAMNELIQENQLGEYIDIGLHNGETNIVVAVTEEGREKLGELSAVHRFIIKDLAIARPYHTHFMDEYNEKLLPFIQKMNFKNADFPILLNNRCELECDGSAIKEETKIQMIKPVFWYESLKKSECDNYLVLDPSKNQCKILSKIVKGKVISISSFASIKNIKIY